jgi:alanyl-tRNA synthetase
MNSSLVRKKFFDFFESKQHKIVCSAPMVVKDDPTLMFTNAGMNQFKDIFLGNALSKYPRVADTQKCLRVSGKHNDLEEVGQDTYHHTMFEMLGNWSFDDYFKKQTIEWAWELLTQVYKIDKNRLYVTVFKGDDEQGLKKDMESYNFWKQIISEHNILFGSKKDNFWEMGDTGPCGPCSEIHIDIRDEQERKKVDGKNLINKNNPLVIEIWNLVFIEFNRLSNGKLVSLPAKHVDTGMGLERLCMILQGVKSNYDTDLFQPIIQQIAKISGKEYGKNQKTDIAMQVIADHLRAVTFAIADGQLPSNNKAGYVIRRILRRAIRYGYTFLDIKEPFINKLVPLLVKQMGDVFPEIKHQQELIIKVITKEEISFLRTLCFGIQKFETYIFKNKNKKYIDGKFAFELFDTYGFPIDLTNLIAKEQKFTVDMDNFNKNMAQQKNRSRKAAEVNTDDWIVLKNEQQTEFVGYNTLTTEAKIIKYRKVKTKNKDFFQIVLDKTPFYAEKGGQSGDKGYLESGNEKIFIQDTKKENELTVHITKNIPTALTKTFIATVDKERREAIACNHSATHLMQAALKQVLGNHIEQRGSLVDENHLRFDFSHFAKMTEQEILKVEAIVNKKIRENIILNEQINVPIEKAKQMGAIALFGEKYGEFVRIITFDKKFSVELCGGTHVKATGQIAMFKIISESAIASGIRRIEAITSKNAEKYFNSQIEIIENLKNILKSPKNIVKSVNNLLDDNNKLQKQIIELNKEKTKNIKTELINKIKQINNINFIAAKVNLDTSAIKNLAFDIKNSVDNIFLVIGSENNKKAYLTVMISENLIKNKNFNAANIVKELAKEINGGGGGQAFYATAGGKNINGLSNAFKKAEDFLYKNS